MSLTTARGVIADEIRRARIEARLGGGHPSADDIADFKATYADAKARLVQTSVRVPWLGGQTKGYALEPNAPLIVSGLPALTWTDVWSPAGSVRVQPLGPVRSLRSLPLSSVRASIRAALVAQAREARYPAWLAGKMASSFDQAECWRDDFPAVGTADLTGYLPFLSLSS